MSTETGEQLQSSNCLNTPTTVPPISSGNNGGGGGSIIDLPFQPNETVGHLSSPPHSYRHSRAYRHFKNPPQPHMCIKVSTINGEELFINVLSWTRIVIPQQPTDPIPLYGGMRVPPGSPRSPPLVYAVMANPEVLKDSGRHSKDPEERNAMVELMCDFVEAMNPDVKLTRNAVILKDRDISGELKDVWNAVQAQRDREREEQLTQQQLQQQQHYHNMQPQQIYLPKAPLQQQQQQLQNQQNNIQTHNNNSTDNKILYSDGVEIISTASCQGEKDSLQQREQENDKTAITTEKSTAELPVAQSAINNKNDNSSISLICEKTTTNKITGVSGKDMIDAQQKKESSLQNDANTEQVNSNLSNSQQQQQQESHKNNISNSGLLPVTNNIATATVVSTIIATTNIVNSKSVTSTASSSTSSNTSLVTTAPTTTTTTTTTTKKEKLSGFLPNGCHSIFPRFKNNKHKDKDKDKDKDKESKSNHSKEKTLLNSLKKTTTAAANAFNNSKSHHHHHGDSTSPTSTKSQYEKNCLNLENEVEKLDLNKMNTSTNNDVFIKLKVASSGAK